MIAVRRSSLVASIALLVVVSGAAAASDELARAKDLYRSASYDEALVVLDQIGKDAAAAASDRLEASEYRLFCLIALDRKADARTTIEGMVDSDPFYQLSPDRASPRVQTMFKEVRQALLPAIVQREYAAAKAAFDRKDAESAVLFDRVLNLLNDSQLTPSPAFTDLRTVASGFRDLSKALAQKPAAPPPAPSPVVATTPAPPQSTPAAANPPSAAPPAAEATSAGASAARATPVLYRDGDPEVVPPVTISQTLPQLRVPPGVRASDWKWEGVLEVIIDESGNVETATLRKPFHPTYDAQIVKAAMSWKYQPARRGGVPVRYVKNVAIRLGS